MPSGVLLHWPSTGLFRAEMYSTTQLRLAPWHPESRLTFVSNTLAHFHSSLHSSTLAVSQVEHKPQMWLRRSRTAFLRFIRTCIWVGGEGVYVWQCLISLLVLHIFWVVKQHLVLRRTVIRPSLDMGGKNKELPTSRDPSPPRGFSLPQIDLLPLPPLYDKLLLCIGIMYTQTSSPSSKKEAVMRTY